MAEVVYPGHPVEAAGSPAGAFAQTVVSAIHVAAYLKGAVIAQPEAVRVRPGQDTIGVVSETYAGYQGYGSVSRHHSRGVVPTPIAWRDSFVHHDYVDVADVPFDEYAPQRPGRRDRWTDLAQTVAPADKVRLRAAFPIASAHHGELRYGLYGRPEGFEDLDEAAYSQVSLEHLSRRGLLRVVISLTWQGFNPERPEEADAVLVRHIVEPNISPLWRDEQAVGTGYLYGQAGEPTLADRSVLHDTVADLAQFPTFPARVAYRPGVEQIAAGLQNLAASVDIALSKDKAAREAGESGPESSRLSGYSRILAYQAQEYLSELDPEAFASTLAA